MIKDRGDWTISRQRAWGLPIPILYAQDKTPIMDPEVFQHIADLFREHGSNIWFEKEAKDLLPEGYTHPNSPDGEFTKEKDILDVWFDSGSSHTAALAKHGVTLPVDLYLEGSDQYRGWFNSSLIISSAVFDTAPYKQVVSHGFIVDEKGEKFSKSKGKALQPKAITERLGAEILRLWVASVDYTSDVGISEALLKQVTEQYRKIRNTFRFMHGNISDFKVEDRVSLNELPSVDRQVLDALNHVLKTGIKGYETYDFSEVTTSVSKFLTNVMSAYYLDFTKDILYIHHENDLRRRQVQTVLSVTLEALMHLLAPILSFTMEELYEIVHPEGKSVQLGEFITHIDVEFDAQADFEQLFELRSAVYKALEEARAEKVIGNSLKAKVKLNVTDITKELIDKHLKEELKQWFIVSNVEFTDEALPEVLGYQVLVEPAQGETCERCWNVVDHLEDGICHRCHQQLQQ